MALANVDLDSIRRATVKAKTALAELEQAILKGMTTHTCPPNPFDVDGENDGCTKCAVPWGDSPYAYCNSDRHKAMHPRIEKCIDCGFINEKPTPGWLCPICNNLDVPFASEAEPKCMHFERECLVCKPFQSEGGTIERGPDGSLHHNKGGKSSPIEAGRND